MPISPKDGGLITTAKPEQNNCGDMDIIMI